MVKEEPQLDIVCVNYSTLSCLDDFYKSLALVDVPYSLVMWDNASDDGSKEWLIENGVGRICFSRENVGYGKGCNMGAALGNARWILFCNSDVAFTEPIMNKWITLAERFDIAVSSCKQVNQEGKLVHAGIYGKYPKFDFRGWLERDDGSKYSALLDTDIAYANGAALLVKRSVWEELGGLLETNLYFEDTWISKFAKKKGYKIGYFGQIKIQHHWNKAPKTSDRLLLAKEGAKVYIKKCKSERVVP
jgi:GT2 family glycosyltransferase